MVSYNIMRGGEGRADPLAEVVLGQRADILGVHEAENDEVLQRLARRLKMEFVAAASVSGRIAIFSRLPIVASMNVALIHSSSMPILDAVIRVGASTLAVRVAHLTHAGEADRMGERLAARIPMVMLMSYEPPLGHRAVEGIVKPASEPVPAVTKLPVRQLDEVLTRREMRVTDRWWEQDRLAYYASDHLPSGAEIELT
jgi:hypothetical protein